MANPAVLLGSLLFDEYIDREEVGAVPEAGNPRYTNGEIFSTREIGRQPTKKNRQSRKRADRHKLQGSISASRIMALAPSSVSEGRLGDSRAVMKRNVRKQCPLKLLAAEGRVRARGSPETSVVLAAESLSKIQ